MSLTAFVHLQIKLAQDAGAIGCIFYNNVEGGLHPKVDEPGITIFGHGISLKQGQILLDQFKAAGSNSIQIVYKADMGVFKNEMGGQISLFSSWGLGPELELKPDLGAPGGYIYSTVPVSGQRGDYVSVPLWHGSDRSPVFLLNRLQRDPMRPCRVLPWRHHTWQAQQLCS